MKKLSSLIIPIFVLTGCQAKAKPVVQHNYHEIKDRRINWEDIFSQEESDYLVYFYSEHCGYCSSIKNEVISYYLKTDKVMYFVCTDLGATFGPQSNLVGIDNVTNFYIFGTPFLVRIMEFKVLEYYVGASSILEFINN